MLVSSTASANDEIYEQMGRYFSDFNEGVAANTMVERYFGDEVFALTSSGAHFYKTKDETANWFGTVLAAIRKEGWQKTILRNHSICMISDTAALYTLKFDRIFVDGREVPGSSVYTLQKDDKWRVVAVTVTSANLGMECPE